MAQPVQQRGRSFGAEKNKIIEQEVAKLMKAGYVSEVQYMEWLSNVVLIPKASRKWRMCTIFTDLKKACPKDLYPLSRIDVMVDSTAGFEMFSMMDAYQGYHQIYMAKEDREKTSFITQAGIYCYNVMPFGLKIAGATYQQFVNRMFDELIGKTMEVYVDDMLVKSKRSQDHLEHLEQTFRIMRSYGIKLNPDKCTFGVSGEKFLGYIVSEHVKVLVRDEEGHQSPVYYVSKMLQGAELRYLEMEKLVLTLVTTARKLRPYFQSHRVVVLTNHPLKYVMSRPEASGRLIKWGVELGQYDIDYQPRTAQKAELLADFVIELSSDPEEQNCKWMLHVDGSSNANNGGAGILIQVPKEVDIEVIASLSFPITNSEAEYEALILGLELVYEAGARDLEVFTESQQVPKAENDKADALSIFGAVMSGIKDYEIVKYLEDGTLPDDPVKAKRVRFRAARFTLLFGQLYKRTVDGPLLKCLDGEKAAYVMREIHEGSYGNHSEIGEESQWVVMYDPKSNQNERSFDLTVIEEKRDAAYAKILHHKGLMIKSHDQKIRPRQLQVGDLVLKKVDVSKHVGKLDAS
ncbi:uncharacterized protein LOC105162366 [Sesamum indicum]|uniref:Uncharacterized protein LOC105162366 n=1 Tax=Sesamum indicum TaxID=4182 RepID=A0A6I9T8R3_SESIN|nr:uncharacterized protein LOC105162366 [Sesamum indicum]